MLHSNKTYDNSNLRDVQKVFRDGIVKINKAKGRELGELLGSFNFCLESISYETQSLAQQDGNKISKSISCPTSHVVIEKGMIATVNGETYIVRHSQFKDDRKPSYYKLYLERWTAYEVVQ